MLAPFGSSIEDEHTKDLRARCVRSRPLPVGYVACKANDPPPGVMQILFILVAVPPLRTFASAALTPSYASKARGGPTQFSFHKLLKLKLINQWVKLYTTTINVNCKKGRHGHRGNRWWAKRSGPKTGAANVTKVTARLKRAKCSVAVIGFLSSHHRCR